METKTEKIETNNNGKTTINKNIDGIMYIGKKPTRSYANAIVWYLKRNKTLKLVANGKMIMKLVDAIEIVKRECPANLTAIKFNFIESRTERMTYEDKEDKTKTRTLNVSSLIAEITHEGELVK